MGALFPSGDPDRDISSLRRLLRRKSEATRLLQRALELLGQVLGPEMDVARYYAEPSADHAFRLLRSRTEEARVFVLLQGDLGSHHTAIDVEVFRGLAIADDVAPFVVINDNDSRAALSFTLLHELTHLLLGQTGFAGVDSQAGVEEFCNNVAAEWLLPARMLDEIEIQRGRDHVEQGHRIAEFTRSRNLSHTMVAYRLQRANRIDRSTFDRLRIGFREQWRQLRARDRARARKSEGGPSYYVLRRRRVGLGLLSFARRMLDSGALSTTKAAKVLGVKPAQVGKMLRPTKAR